MAVNNSINEAMDVQTFTSTGAGTWTKPNGAKFVYVVCVGGGGVVIIGGHVSSGIYVSFLLISINSFIISFSIGSTSFLFVKYSFVFTFLL